jgi:hypothetical protein
MADTTMQQLQGFDPELQDITRQREMAKALMQQGFQQPNMQGQMIGGHYVGASPWQGIANLYSTYRGKQLAKEADIKESQLADALRKQTVADIQAYGQAVKGAPEQTIYGAGEEGPTMNVTPAVAPDYEKGLGILMGSKSPQSQALAQALLQDQLKTHILPAEGTLVRGSLGGVGGQTIQGAPKEPTEYKEYLKAKEGGFPGSFFQYQTALKQAGAQPIMVSTGKDLAGQVGDIMKTSSAAATGAYQTAQSADKILGATDKAITGKGAETRLNLNQWADTLGIAGKDTQDKVAKTREVMQETAKLALSAPPKGQGAVSDYERALFARAAGGDVNLTPTELKLIANRAKEAANYTIQSHEQKLKAMASNPETAQLVPYYSVQAPTPVAQPAMPAQPFNGGWRIK